MEIPEGVEVLTELDRVVAAVVLPTKIEEVVEEEEVVEGVEGEEGEEGEEKAETKEEPPSSKPKKE